MPKPSAETMAWAREVGLTKLRAKWSTSISLDVNGEIPKRAATARSTRFRLKVAETAWSVTVWNRGVCFDYGKTSGARAATIDHSLPLVPPKLSKILAWLGDVERELGVTFRRDRPGISSNVQGATKAIVGWLTVAQPGTSPTRNRT